MNTVSNQFKCAAIQMHSSDDIAANLKQSENLVRLAAQQEAHLVVLPETFALIGKSDADQLRIAETYGDGKIQNAVARIARRFGVWIVAGTIPLKLEHSDRAAAGCILFSDKGEPHAVYHKIHLFDVNLPNGSASYHESDVFTAGNQPLVVTTPFAKLGIAVCYDVRFPELFRLMTEQGAQLVVIPAAFTALTGKAHWETLLRARAIENQLWIVGAGQCGTHANGKQTYGNSMIIGPWGDVTEKIDTLGEDICISTIDLDQQDQLRHNFPCLEHRIFK